MLKLSELKTNDLVLVNEDGTIREGRVVEVNHTDNKVLVDNGVQDFWYTKDALTGILINDTILMNKLGFEKQAEDGFVKYKKDAFRLVVKDNYDFSHIDMWYREDRRSFNTHLATHTLQNLFYDMTKIHLEPVGMEHE